MECRYKTRQEQIGRKRKPLWLDRPQPELEPVQSTQSELERRSVYFGGNQNDQYLWISVSSNKRSWGLIVTVWYLCLWYFMDLRRISNAFEWKRKKTLLVHVRKKFSIELWSRDVCFTCWITAFPPGQHPHLFTHRPSATLTPWLHPDKVVQSEWISQNDAAYSATNSQSQWRCFITSVLMSP